MGRGKLKLELIPKEKSRLVTFKKRKSGLLKKAEEFSKLCDVDTCVIIFGPKLEKGPGNVEIFPPDPNKVRNIIDKFKSNAANGDKGKSYDLPEHFDKCKKKVDDEIHELRKANKEARFPSSWDHRFDVLSSDQLRVLDAIFDTKLQVAKKKIQDLRKKGKQIVTEMEFYNQQPISTHVKPLDMQLPAYCSSSQVPRMPSFVHNPIADPMRMSMMNGEDYNLYGSGMSRSNISYSQTQLPPYHDPMATRLGNVLYNPRSLPLCYYGPTTQQTAPYEQQVMPNDFSQVNASQIDGFLRDYIMKGFKHEDRV